MITVIKSELTVVGGGYAGICAAIAAARNGLKVALINDRDVLGGNASSEHRIHVNGAATGNNTYYSREAGISEELKLYTLHKNPRYNTKNEYHLHDMALYQKVLNEKNITLFLGTVVTDCECKENRIIKAFAFKSKTQQNFVFESDCFVDASGDGILGFKTGAEFRVGREARSEFDESLAPEVADSNVMGSCILFRPIHTGKKVVFKKPDFAYDLVDDGIIKYFDRPDTGRSLPVSGGQINSLWWLEYGGLSDTVLDSDNIDLELRKLVYGYWDYIKNSGKYPETDDCELEWIAPAASKRESRRFMGDYILTQKDIQEHKTFEDAVAVGGWSLDIHDVGGIYGVEETSAFGEVKATYEVPYSIMYSKDISNLFLAGRLISCTHVALGSLRVIQTLGSMAQVVGTAAVLCKKHGVTPRDIKNNYIDELRSILQRDGHYLIGMKEDCGLASKAKLSCSSTKAFESTSEDYELPLSEALVYALPSNNKLIESIDIRVKNNSSSEVVLKCEILDQDHYNSYNFGEKIAEREVVVPANFNGYLTLPLGIKTQGNKFFIRVLENESLSLFASANRVTGAPSFAKWSRLSRDWKDLSLCFKNFKCGEELYSVNNLINGFSRPLGLPNCWISKGKENEWVELEFDEMVDINEIQLYFNPQFETEHFNDPIKQLITEYKVTVVSDNGEEALTVKDNYHGRNKIDFVCENVQKIRVDFIANNGAPEFEVFAIKVF